MKEKKHKKSKAGPKMGHLKLNGNWEANVANAVKKARPKEGWPKPDEKNTGK